MYEILLLHNGPVRFDHGFMKAKPHALSLLLGVSLLATCRQVNSEALGLLYGQNTFLVSSRTVYVSTPWLAHIGSNSKSVRKLIIEVQPGRWGPVSVHILPLLRHCWSQNRKNLQVSIAEVSGPLYLSNSVLSSGATLNLAGMNRALTTLKDRTASELAFYLRLSRTLASVSLSTDAKEIKIGIRPHNCQSSWAATRAVFQISDTGTISRGPVETVSSSLEQLLLYPDVRKMLSDLVAGSSEAVFVDLELGIMSGVPSNMLGLNASIRDLLCCSLSRKAQRIRITTRTRESSFRDFKSMTEFFRTGPFLAFRGYRRLGLTTVTLRYELNLEPEQKEIRVCALDLIKATSSLPP